MGDRHGVYGRDPQFGLGGGVCFAGGRGAAVMADGRHPGLGRLWARLRRHPAHHDGFHGKSIPDVCNRRKFGLENVVLAGKKDHADLTSGSAGISVAAGSG